MHADLIEEGVGRSLPLLEDNYGIEVTKAENGEIALILQGDLFSVYEEAFEIPTLVEDIKYIIREEIY